MYGPRLSTLALGFPAEEGEFKLTPKSSNWGGRRPGAGRPRKPRVMVACDVWPETESVEASAESVTKLARSRSAAALLTIIAIAQRSSDEGVRVLAASRFLDIAERLGALRRPPRP